MKHLHRFNEDFLPKLEGFGGLRGPFGLPNIEDISDILKGFSKKKVLEWTPPRTRTGKNRIALSKTEGMLKDKKKELLKHYKCPEDWYYKSLTIDDIKDWKDSKDK